MQIGIGTYSFGGIESFFGLGPSLKEIFTKISSLGFDSVELLERDLMTNSLEDIQKWLDETGLKVTSVHAMPTKEIIDRMAVLHGQAVICASAPFNCRSEAEELAADLGAMADYAAPLGIKVAYHNHNREFYFTEGKTLLEHLLDSNDKIYAQLDCGWCMAGGTYPPNFIRKYRNRICAIHVKENERVIGPGPCPVSRHAETGKSPLGDLDINALSVEEKKAILENIKKSMSKGGSLNTDIQCPMGAPTSNIDWKEIRSALNEQDFDAFWVVEREHFYKDHDECIAEDCRWLRENIQ